MNCKKRALSAALVAAFFMSATTVHAEDLPPEVQEVTELDQTDAEEAEELIEETEELLEEIAEEAEEAEDELGSDDDDEDKPWSVSASARMNVSQGTFARIANDSQWADEVHDGSGAFNRVSMQFSVNPSYRWNDFTFSSSLSFSQWLTAGGGSIRPYEGRFGDLGINASGRFTGWEVDSLGLRVTPSASLNVPIIRSPSTRTSTFRGSLGGGLSASKTFFRQLTLSYSLSGSRSFHDYTSRVLEIDRIGEENALFRAEGAEAVAPGLMAVAGINTPWSLNNSLSASFRVGKVGASVSYAYSRRWSYAVTEEDQYMSELQCAGRCVGDSMRGSISLSYRLNDRFNLSGGLTSGGLPKTSDQQSYNFPFWNFNSAVGPSAVNVGISGSY